MIVLSERVHPQHEPLQKALLKAAIEKWSQDVGQETGDRQSRMTDKEKKPFAAVRPRGKSVPPPKKPPSTVPVTPNVLKKRTMPRLLQPFKPEPYVFKAKPAPLIHNKHKSCSNLNKAPQPPATVIAVTRDLNRLTVNPTKPVIVNKRPQNNKENQPIAKNKIPATVTAPLRNSRLKERSNEVRPRVRSNSAPGTGKATALRATIPITPMVLKRNNSRTRHISQGDAKAQPTATYTDYHFKAKPAEVLHRKPFKPRLAINTAPTVAPTAVTTKPFDFCLESRLKDRRTFNHRSTDAMERKHKQLEEEKKRAAEEQYVAARKLTNFRATRNPFK